MAEIVILEELVSKIFFAPPQPWWGALLGFFFFLAPPHEKVCRRPWPLCHIDFYVFIYIRHLRALASPCHKCKRHPCAINMYGISVPSSLICTASLCGTYFISGIPVPYISENSYLIPSLSCTASLYDTYFIYLASLRHKFPKNTNLIPNLSAARLVVHSQTSAPKAPG